MSLHSHGASLPTNMGPTIKPNMLSSETVRPTGQAVAIFLGKIAAALAFAAVLRKFLGHLSPALAVGAATSFIFGCFVFVALRRVASFGLRDALALLAATAISAIAVMPAHARHFVGDGWLAWLFGAPIAFHILWGTQRAVKGYRGSVLAGRERLELALSEIIPQRLARVAAAELNVISNAFRWTSPPDVPLGAKGFSYHRLVAPMMWAFFFLAALETLVLHLLLGIWNSTVAWIVFIISDISLLYLLGLIVSLRRLPITIDDRQVRIRAGILYDFTIPLASITNVNANFPSTDVKRPGTLKTSLMAFPNIILEFTPPIPSPKPMGLGDPINSVAMALDDRVSFVEEIRAHALKSSSS